MLRRVVTVVLGLVLTAGCAATSPEPQAAPQPETRVVEITLADGRVEPSGERVEVSRGTTLELVVTSDHSDQIHVHGYEVEFEVEPGETVREQVVLDRIGRYEVESHEPALTILQLIVS